jgi:hypothetical protein
MYQGLDKNQESADALLWLQTGENQRVSATKFILYKKNL